MKKRRLLSSIMVFIAAFIIMLGIFSVPTLAASTGDSTETVTEMENVAVTIRGIHSAQISYAKLYSYDDKETKTTDFLEGLTTTYDSQNYNYYYSTSLQPGDYWVEGYDENDDYNGGMQITVTEDSNQEFYIQRVYEIYCSNSGWVQDTDYKIKEVVVKNGSVVRNIELGTAKDYYGNAKTSCLFMKGDTISATFTPIGDKAGKYVEATFTKTAQTINVNLYGSLSEGITMTFTVPADSTVDVGKTTANNYYLYNYYTPVNDPETSEDGKTETWTYLVPKDTVNLSSGPYFFYRVKNADGVTYWDFFNPNTITETAITLTEDDLFIGEDDGFDKDTVIRGYAQNKYDTANIYMNINAQGYKNMAVGDTYELNIFRNWQAIEHYYNRMIALPDVNYEIIPLDDSTTAPVSIEKDEKNSGLATMKAEAEGTALVLVTYDAMYHAKAMTDYGTDENGTDGGYYQPSKFSATWPEFTGVFVVSVGKDGTTIDTGMSIDRLGKDGILDAEHDFLFYTGTAGATYSFTPEAGTTVAVSRSTVSADEELTFADFEEVTAVDGTYTITGLKTGRHIIRVTKGDVASYQVVTAKQVSYELQDEEGNPLAEDAEIKAGDTVYVQFEGLVNPCEKMAGIYNHAAIVQYQGEDGTVFTSTPGGTYGVYDFSSDFSEQRFTITIPKYWDGTTYTLDGAINLRISGESPSKHRTVSYMTGASTNNNAAQSIGTLLCDLPEITIDITETDFLTGSLSFENESGESIAREDVTVVMTDADGNEITLKDDSTFTCMPGEYFYTVYAAGYMYETGNSVTVTEDGDNSFVITLTKSSENAWDGLTLTEPTAVDSIYQIGTGAELAWYANAVNEGSGASAAVLTADIDLAGYPWTPIGGSTTTGKYLSATFDGANHTVKNLYINADSSSSLGYVGLFGYVGSGATVKDLTVKGEIITVKQNAGGIAGALSTATVENCVNYVNINSSTNYTGGIAGTAAYSTIKGSANHGTITSATAEGSSTTTAYTGGIVGSTSSSTTKTTIINCYNDGTVNGQQYTGGIVGSASGLSVTGCYNSGAVNGTVYVGGIAGSLSGGYYAWTGGTTEVKACYNKGAVSATTYAGGLSGTIGFSTVYDFYNIGNVTGTGTESEDAVVGGVVAILSNANVKGARIYYLEGTAARDAASSVSLVKTAEDLKNAELNTEYYAGTCNGYPALLWQTNVTFHDKDGEPTVTAPTCLEKGYTTYSCSNCGESYITDYVDALGHTYCTHTEIDKECTDCTYTEPDCTNTGSVVRTCTFEGCTETKTDTVAALGHTWCECTEENAECEHCTYTAPTCTEEGSIVRNCTFGDCDEEKTDVLPANGHTPDDEQTVEHELYDECVCSVCGVDYLAWQDDRLQYMTLDLDVLSEISFEDNDYPWVYNADKERIESTNKAIDSSTSQTSITVTLKDAATVSFNYGASSEYYDKVTITASSGGTTIATIMNNGYFEKSGTFEQTLPAGTYTLTFMYVKNWNSASYDDCGWFSDMTVAVPKTTYTVTLPTDQDGYTVEPTADYTTTVESGKNFAFTVTTKPGYVKGDDFAVKEGDNVLSADVNGNYVLTNITEDKNITVTGVEEIMDTEVTVYFTVSKNNDFITKNDTVLALKELTVPYFDLAYYGLDNVYYNPDCYKERIEGINPPTNYGGTPETANGKVTMLHVFIYATEVYCYDVKPEEAGKGFLKNAVWSDTTQKNYLKITAEPGAIFLEKFWDFGSYVNYYLNYEYPLAAEAWGATADQIVLTDKDVVSVRYNANSSSGDNGTYYHFGEKGDLECTVAQGEKVTLSLYATEADSVTYETTHVLTTTSTNVYVTADSAPKTHKGLTAVGTTTNGQITLDTSKWAEGVYYVTTNTHDPAVIKLTVTEGTGSETMKGDVSGDGEIHASDAALILRYVAGYTDVEINLESADVNGDGEVHASDAALILRYVSGELKEFPNAGKN